MPDQVRVLIIEDNPIDALLERKALAAIEQCQFSVIENGHEAFEFLKHCGIESLPELIILDLNLPGRNGHEILELIRAKRELHDIPVAIVSSSPEEVIQQHAAYADCCMRKPFQLEDFRAKAQTIMACYRESRRANGKAANV